MTIIFAVTKDQIPVYHELSKLIEGSTVGELANDSSNIVELVKENYDVSAPPISAIQHYISKIMGQMVIIKS